MKTKLFILLILLVGCRYQQNQSNKLILKDSLQIAKEDSITQAIATEKAYANRPWQLNSFVDDFGDAAKGKYIYTQVEGVFSNSATAGSYLYVEVLFSKNAAGIFLHEYKETNPAEKIIGTATIMLKNSKEEIFTVRTGHEWSNSGGIRVSDFNTVIGIYDYDYTNLRKFIQKSVGEIKVVIKDEYSSSYKFTIDATGFASEFSLL